MPFEYNQFTSLVAEGKEGITVTLSPLQHLIIRAATTAVHFRSLWVQDGAALSDAQWDVIDAAVAGAIVELETPGGSVTAGKLAVAAYGKLEAQGVATDEYTIDQWNTLTEWDQRYRTVESVVHDYYGGTWSFPAGLYRVDARVPIWEVDEARLRLYNDTEDAVVWVGESVYATIDAGVSAWVTLTGYFEVTDSDEYCLQIFYGRDGGSRTLGRFTNVPSTPEWYWFAEFMLLEPIQLT